MYEQVAVTQAVALRGMCEADLQAVAAIEVEAALSLWGMHGYRRELDNPDATLLVCAAPVGTEVLGFLCARTQPLEQEMLLLNIGVRAQYRRGGIGSALMKELILQMQRQGITRAYLEVRASNLGAQAFYQRFGFSVVGKRRDYYREPLEDAMLMARGTPVVA